MSTKEKIYNLIDNFSETQLNNVLSILESLQSAVYEAEDEAYCKKLYDDYAQNREPVSEMMDINDFAKELGITLE